MTLLNEKFKYTSAEDSRKPNYLRNRFNAIRKAQREAAEAQKKADEEASVKVTAMGKRGRA